MSMLMVFVASDGEKISTVPRLSSLDTYRGMLRLNSSEARKTMNTNNGGIIAASANVDPNAADRAPQPVDFRLRMIKIGLEAEMMGMRLTSKAPPCFSIVAKEYGIKVKRGSGAEGKRAAYEAFCARVGLTPKAPKPPAVLAALAPPTVNG